MVEVADAGSIAAALLLEEVLGVRYGGSSGTNFIACLQLASDMRARGERGSIVSLLCDRGTRYQQTLFDPAWRAARGVDIGPWQRVLSEVLTTGTLVVPESTGAQAGLGPRLDLSECSDAAIGPRNNPGATS